MCPRSQARSSSVFDAAANEYEHSNATPVVKAFNTIRPASLASLGKPAGAAGRAVIPVAGDDPVAKSVVLELRDQLGFDSLDAGPLADSWRQQPSAYCKLPHIQRQGLCWWTAHDAHAGMPRLRR